MKSFKFLSDNDDIDDMDDMVYLDDSSPSWMWQCHWPDVINTRHEVKISHHAGIHGFLSMFPDYSITPVISITGPNNRVHTCDGEYDDGWGFDITEDIITVQWINFLPDEN